MSNADHIGLARSIRRHLLVSGLASLFLVAGIGGWAAATNLAGAVVAAGHFVVDSYVKKVQHPTGGVVGEILVREGQRVTAGDVVMRLDATQTRSNLAIVTKRLDEFAVRRARLEAERDEAPEISFPAALMSARRRRRHRAADGGGDANCSSFAVKRVWAKRPNCANASFNTRKKYVGSSPRRTPRCGASR